VEDEEIKTVQKVRRIDEDEHNAMIALKMIGKI
jgi:hypothetical protein